MCLHACVQIHRHSFWACNENRCGQNENMFHYLKDYLIDSLEAPRGTSETTLMDLVLL